MQSICEGTKLLTRLSQIILMVDRNLVPKAKDSFDNQCHVLQQSTKNIFGLCGTWYLAESKSTGNKKKN